MTPSNWNKDVFIKGGIKRPIYVVPLGVNTDIYKPGLSKLPISCRELPSGQKVNKFPSFNYITLFGWSYRKGIDVLIKSYCDRFTSKDDVGFIVCSRYMGSSDLKAQRVVERDILDFMKGYTDPPRVYYYGENTDINLMPNLMANGDCFVWGSRGEGFGLPILEAGSMEIPVISTYTSSMTDFLREDNSFLVETDKFVVAPRNISCISPYYVGQLFPELGKGVIKKFGERMKEVYDNYSLAKKKAQIFSAEIKEKYNWDVCAENVVSVLGKLKEEVNA
jgi:glycosyltransferase involved in cell wall biosynthesis